VKDPDKAFEKYHKENPVILKLCETCKHWEPDFEGDLGEYPPNFPIGKCTRVKNLWKCNKDRWKGYKEFDWFNPKEAEGHKAFVQDGVDSWADLITMKDFGCVQWEGK